MHMKFPHLHKHLERSVHICAWPRVCVAVLSWEESEQWPPSVCCKHRSMIVWVWALAQLFVVVLWHGEVNQRRDFGGGSFAAPVLSLCRVTRPRPTNALKGGTTEREYYRGYRRGFSPRKPMPRNALKGGTTGALKG